MKNTNTGCQMVTLRLTMKDGKILYQSNWSYMTGYGDTRTYEEISFEKAQTTSLDNRYLAVEVVRLLENADKWGIVKIETIAGRVYYEKD